LKQLAESRFGQVQIVTGRFSAFLFKCVEHMDGFFKLCDVKNPVLQFGMNPNLLYSGTESTASTSNPKAANRFG
jgi:hypothetical protein